MTIKEVTPHHIFVEVPELIGNKLDGVYLKSRKVWRIPFNLGALRDLHKLGYDVLELGKQLSEEYKDTLDLKSLSSSAETKLREYQAQDVTFLVSQKYAGVFNEQRTGKTPTMCRVLERIRARTAIICPASLILNWRDEVSAWTTMNPIVAMGTKKKREAAYKEFYENGGVLIVGKETARNDVGMLQSLKIHTLVVDEAHFLRNRSSKQSTAIVNIGRVVQRRYVLTGTPATSSPADVFGILHFLDPERWSSYWQFAERYFNISKGFAGSRNIGKFKSAARKREYEEILNLVSVQRKRKDVMKWLPTKQYQTVKLKLEGIQKRAYDEMLNTFEVEAIDLDASTVLAQMTRLRQITSVPATLGLDEMGVKFNFILQWLEDNPDEQLLVFSNFSSGLIELRNALMSKRQKVGTIIGENSKEQRNDCVQRFQNGHLQVLLCNIESAGTGLTLDAAGTVIFLDRHYNPTQNEQAEDRIVATQQDRNLNALIIDLVCEDTIDEKILQLVKEKKSITAVANNYRNVRDWLK